MKVRRIIPIGALVTLAAPAATAQTPPRLAVEPPCAPPAEFAHWRQYHGVTAARRFGVDAVPELSLGGAVDLALAPIGSIGPAAPLGRPSQPSDHGGLAAFRVASSGAYRIALGGRAWIDVVRQGEPIASVAHRMGSSCAGIAKMVDFRLEPGLYTIQLSADADPGVRIAIVKLP